MTASRNTPAKPNHRQNRSFITSGEIGTNAMHPPGKRSMGINISINININKSVSIRAGGHSGPPLRGGFVSMRGMTKAEPCIKRNFETSGEIGTNAMHPPGERSMNISN